MHQQALLVCCGEDDPDKANHNQEGQDWLFNDTRQRLFPFQSKLVYLRMLTSEAAPIIPNVSLEFTQWGPQMFVSSLSPSL